MDTVQVNYLLLHITMCCLDKTKYTVRNEAEELGWRFLSFFLFGKKIIIYVLSIINHLKHQS